MSFMWLLFAHYVGDYGLQGTWMAMAKRKNWYIVLCHSMTWSACVCVALQYLGLLDLWKAVFLVLGHTAIDYVKTRGQVWKVEADGKLDMRSYVDQAAHLVQLLVVYFVR